MLQKYLRALLAQFVNKKDGEFISTQCTPSSNIIDIKIPTTNDAQRYTAPCNGYLVIGVESLNGVSSITSWGKIDSTITANMSGNGHHSAVFVPMQKGDVQHYTSQTKYRYVHFVKMMGGANSILNPILLSIRGGGLCLILSHFLTHLRAKSDCRSLLNMSRMNFRRGVQTRTKQICPLLRHLTDLFKFAHGGIMGVASQTHRLKQEEERFLVGRCGEVPQNHLTHERTCLLEKATKSLFNYQLDQVRPLKEESLSLSASVRSLSFGGALC